MENTGVIEQNDPWSNDLNESDLNDTPNEISPTLIYENDSELSVLGSSYRVPDILKKHIEPIVLDTSLSYIPVYTHLKTCDLKPIQRPSTPPILAGLRLKCQ
ncbi:PREDICTED: uncharacterized protein LOC108553350 [Eufriesea mexicana]|uniref:uncharacterized protein LOC108553350 n=1 Tax=Eufriesea mexicana TaxID=516756 RepID=UPI00083C3ECB|nr:PREDICTED: uncharacterized protein LOC108553350 [Eufriesea mexicana]